MQAQGVLRQATAMSSPSKAKVAVLGKRSPKLVFGRLALAHCVLSPDGLLLLTYRCWRRYWTATRHADENVILSCNCFLSLHSSLVLEQVVTSMLLKKHVAVCRNPLVAELSLYDVVGTPGVAADLAHIDTAAKVLVTPLHLPIPLGGLTACSTSTHDHVACCA